MSVGRDVVVLSCALSAGIHAALTPEHGVAFVAAAALLALVVLALTLRVASALALATAATVLAGLLGSYALAVTTGLPLVHPGPEQVGGLAVATKAIEAVGLATAVALLRRRSFSAGTRPIPTALAGMVAVYGALAALALSSGHGTHASAADVRTDAQATLNQG